MKTNVGQRIIYVEPNDVYDGSLNETERKTTNVQSITPVYENFCISFNLIIEQYGRFKNNGSAGHLNEDGKRTYSIEWGITPDELIKQRTSVLQGEKFGEDCNYLTTYYTDLDFDSYKKNQIEGLGVESVQISYENWYIPTVVIKFVDVRGSALFGREETIHTDEKLTAENIFGAFFTIPYPLFRLQVKGFLGKPVTYQLTCSGFKGNLNPQTGNFEAVATFIGYSWSLMTDIPFMYLMAAPNSNYIGRDYWERHVNTPSWGLWHDDNSSLPPPKLTELFRRIKQAKETIKDFQSAATNEQNERLQNINTEKELLHEVSSKLNLFLSNIELNSQGYHMMQYDIDEKSEQALFFSDEENIVLSDITMTYFNDFYESLKDYTNAYTGNEIKITKSPNKWTNCPKILKCIDLFNIEKDNNGITKRITLKGFNNNTENTIRNITFNDNRRLNGEMARFLSQQIRKNNGVIRRYAYVIDLYDLRNCITETNKDFVQQEERIIMEVNNRIQSDIVNIIGFKPYIGNIFKIIFCHLETFCHILFDSANEIYNQMPRGLRQPSFLAIDINQTDILSDVSKDVVPWPAVFNNGFVENNTGYESDVANVYGWVGDFSHNFIEEKVVYGLQEGIQEIMDTKSTPIKRELNYVGFPLLPSDMREGGSPFAMVTDADISDLSGYLAMRAASIIGVVNGNNITPEMTSLLGKLDAYNFYASVASTDKLKKTIQDTLKGFQFEDIFSGIAYCNNQYDNFARGRSADGATRYHSFETEKYIKKDYNNQQRHAFFKSENNYGLFIHWYDKNGLNYVPSNLQHFNNYGVDFSYGRAQGTEKYGCFKPLTNDLVAKDWLYISDSSKVDFHSDDAVVLMDENEKYKNYAMFSVITENDKVDAILNKAQDLLGGNNKIYDFEVKENIEEYVKRFIKVDNKSYSRFFNSYSTMLSGDINSLGVEKDYLLPTEVNGDAPKDFRYNKWLAYGNKDVKNNVTIKDDGNIVLNGETTSIDNVTIQEFKIYHLGSSNNNGITGECSLFGCPFYYLQNIRRNITGQMETDEEMQNRVNKTKALLFLHTFKYDYNEVINVFNKRKTNGATERVPKAYLLFLGGMLWRKRFYKKTQHDPITYSNGKYSYKWSDNTGEGVSKTMFILKKGHLYFTTIERKNTTLNYNFNVNNLFGGLNEIDFNIENQLIDLFEDFANKTYPTIADKYELKDVSRAGTLIKEYDINTLVNDINILRKFYKGYGKQIEYEDVNDGNSSKTKIIANNENYLLRLRKNGCTNWEGKYVSMFVRPGDYGITMLMNEEDNEMQTLFKDLYFGGYVITDNCFRRMGKSLSAVDNNDRIKVYSNLYTSYLKGFNIGINNVINGNDNTVNTETPNQETNNAKASEANINASIKTYQNRDLSIGIYYYLKNVWDRWMVCAKNDTFDVDNFFNKNFVFIDSFYRNTYHHLAINCQLLYDAYDRMAEESNLFSFIGEVTKDHHCLFLPVPDYVGFNGNTQKHDIEVMENLFKPLPYSAMSEPSNNNKYVCIYTHNPAEKVTEDNGYVQDSYDIWSHGSFTDEALKIFSTNDERYDRNFDIATRVGYNVPSFGVAFSRQNNHIFKSINVNMDNPVATEQSIKSMYHIALKGQTSGRTFTFTGQDTFNIFSNYSYSCNIEMLGNAQICPLMYFQLLNVPMWRGTYMIYKVAHTMTPGNMTTSITGMKMSRFAKPFNTNFYTVLTLPEQGENAEGEDYRNNCDDDENDSYSKDNGKYTPGEYKPNPIKWNIQSAVNYLKAKYNKKSTHSCAKYVRMAMEAGGLNTSGRPNLAWRYIFFLPKIGFKHLATFNSVQEAAKFNPRIGDLAVYQENGEENIPGHICMWTGNYWCSDFRQNKMVVYSQNKIKTGIYLFRYDNV